MVSKKHLKVIEYEPVQQPAEETAEKLRRLEEFLKVQHEVFYKWSISEAVNSGNYLAALQEITEDAARTLEVERVGVWFYDEKRTAIECVDQYCRSSRSHSVGACLAVAGYPAYFKALEAEGQIAAHDAQSDARTREFTPSYLRPLGITSLLDAPIRRDGRIIGIVCHEQVGPQRCWTAAEQNFAISVAYFISQAIRRRDQKKAEESLENQIRFLQCLLDTIPNPVYYKDRQGKYVSCNSAYEEFHGMSREEILGRTVFDIAPTKWAERYTELDQELITKGGTQVYEGEAFQFGGESIDAIFYKSAFSSSDGSPEGVVGVIVDINERKRMEAALEESEKQYRELVDNIPVGILRSTLDGKMIMANSKACSMFGFESKAEMLTLKAADIYAVPAESRAFLKRLLKEVEVEGAELRLKRKDGTTFWASIRSRVIKNEKGKTAYIDSVIQDIDEQKRSELALRESEARYRLLIDNAGDGIVLVDNHGRLLILNPVAARFLGGSPEDFTGKTVQELFPEGADEYMEYVRKVTETGSGVNFTTKIKYRGESRWCSVNIQPIRDVNAPSTGIQVMARDITEQMQIEQEITRLDRLNLVGEMAASIGHEVRNPLATVRGFLQLLGERSAGDERQERNREYYMLMIGELDRANAIISEFLTLSKHRAIDRRPANLNQVIDAILPLIQADAIISDKYVKTELEDVPDLLLDEKEVRQLILNLVRNGLEAMGPQGVLTITTVMEHQEVVLAVEDQGQGIDPGIIEKLGTPFVTTKEEGTGLGLAVCYSIAARHGAAIEVETGCEGTVFRVRFKLDS